MSAISDFKEKSLQELHDMRLGRLVDGTLGIELDTAYWEKRAEASAREIMNIRDVATTDRTKGQISICYETADENRRTLKEIEEKANSERSNRTSERKGASVV